MKLGIIGNTHKENLRGVLDILSETFISLKINATYHEDLKEYIGYPEAGFADLDTIGATSDFLVSIGGDGTLLASSVTAYKYDKPIVGVNIGKLGFLAELPTEQVKEFFSDLQQKKWYVEERIVLLAESQPSSLEPLIAFNDFVIDKGGWPKMIEMKLFVDEEYVTTFAADGLIMSTPSGSTGYNLSAGGPIVTPGASVITLSPISAHSLTIRPLVIDARQKVKMIVGAHQTKVHVNCDGQRVIEFQPPFEINITQSDRKLKLLRSPSFSYFQVLRSKLFWGADYRIINTTK
ncbi:MAG: NAD(+)/NADH kinase [Ignavibacteriales bacterium]|nr:NAD(+)/NADH kinase [Ignavibacteriales bacterium]